MKIWAFTTSHWNDVSEANSKGDGPFGLRTWHDRVTRYFSPTHCFVACGTWSDPVMSPFPATVPIVNAGVTQGTKYDVQRTQLWMCAMTAACAYALNRRNEWDLLVFLDTDILVGAVDFDALIKEFSQRQEILLAQRWNDAIGGPFYVWKPDGVVRAVHYRTQPNIANHCLADSEAELRTVFDGLWWNNWPDIPTMRQDGDAGLNEHVLRWPFVRCPHPSIVEQYQQSQTILAKPVREA